MGVNVAVAINSVTYAGQAMTLIASNTVGSSDQYVYGIVAPTTGSNNIVITLASSSEARSTAIAYSGVDPTLTVNGSTTAVSSGLANTSMSISLTPSVAGCHMIAFGGAERVPSASTGSTLRASAGSETVYRVFDSNGTIANGVSNSMAITYIAIDNDGMSMAAVVLAPGAFTTTITDSMTLADSSFMGLFATITDSISMAEISEIVRNIWRNITKNSVTFINRTKTAISPTNISKSVSSWINRTKN